MKKICIAIDGPASSGKSTVAKKLAKRLNYIYLDTGAMYRCLTLAVLNKKIDARNETEVIDLCKHITIEFVTNEHEQIVLLNDVDVTKDIRSLEVTNLVSLVSSYELVRKEMVLRQQKYIQNGGIIMDGRDIGTVVMPDAELKIFMVASARERAKRRYLENQEKGITISIDDLQKQIEERDHFDSTREQSPLKKADTAISLDTTYLSIDEVVETIEKQVYSILKVSE